ncbi:MAG: STAS domain-containing protein [SAR324 cluster bacterium]|nr:STAS domain-containing protein [SAR324 cluster bacterium]
MQISHYEENQFYVISIAGDISRMTTGKINQYLKPLLFSVESKSKLKGVVLDCSQVESIDSAGVGLLCGKHVNLKKQSKKMAISGLSSELHKSFQQLDLTGRLNIYSSLQEAISILGVS